MAYSGKVHVFGGTSDAVAICQMLQQQGILYSLSVATDTGEEMAAGLNGSVYIGRMDVAKMKAFFDKRQPDLIIDATHPYACEVSLNVQQAVQDTRLPLIRYERATQIDSVENSLLIKVPDIETACVEVKKLGERVLLTTGSKDLAAYKKLLPEKKLIARVLPTIEAIEQCMAQGLGIGQIIALKGPFTQQMNKAMYQFYEPNVVITKESGKEGGYIEKIMPCLELGIACVVLCRPRKFYQHIVSTISELKLQLETFL